MPSESHVPTARIFVRSLNILLKFARLYGLEHKRSAGQFDSAWAELQDIVQSTGDTGLLLGAAGSQLLLDGVPLESTPAERSFADLLTTAGVASICFTPNISRDDFSHFVRAFMETNVKSGGLAEKLQEYLGKNSPGIRVNEIRFVAEDAAHAETRVAALLTANTLGVDADKFEDWLRSPEKMIELIAAAEGSHGGPGGPGEPEESRGLGRTGGAGLGPGSGSGPGMGAGSAGISAKGSELAGGSGLSGVGAGAARGTGVASGGPGAGGGFATGGPANGTVNVPMSELELQSLLKLLGQIGEAASGRNPPPAPAAWKQRMASLPRNAKVTLLQALARFAAIAPAAKVSEAMLLRLAEDLAIRFALERYQSGEVRVHAVRQLLDRMSQELETLRKLLRAREERLANAGVAVESHADILDRQFWAAVPESSKRRVLMSSEAWCIPPRNIQQYVEELLRRGESDTARDILLGYAACIRNKDAEARKKAAIGLGQLAELFSRVASQRLQDALSQIGEQMAEEQDAESQTLISAAFVRLSQEAASRRYYRAMKQSLDSLAKVEELRPSWVQSLRPRIGVENRVPEFVEEAVTTEVISEGLVEVLERVPQTSAEQLAVRLARVGRRSERERVVELAKALGDLCVNPLRETLRSEPAAKAASVVGLLSRLDPQAVADLLPARLREGQKSFHDAAVRQLSIGGAAERGKLLADSLEAFDPMVLPLALDEIGMCGDAGTASKLLRLAEGEFLQEGADYLRVKAIEALGRMRAPTAAGHLRRFVVAKKTFGWAYPEEIRVAAAQALMKLDPAWMQAFMPQSGLDPKVLALAPLDPLPERDFVRHRRYRRIRLPRSVPAVISSPRGKHASSINVLSLEGGLLSGDLQLAVGTEATLRIPAGMRSISMRAVVRFVRAHQAGFEMVGMALEDRAKLRRLLVSLGGSEAAAPIESLAAE